MKLHPITQELLEFKGTPEDLVEYIRKSDHIPKTHPHYSRVTRFLFPFWDYEISEQDLQVIFHLIDKYRSKRKNCDELKCKWEKIYREGWEYENIYDISLWSEHIIHSELWHDLVKGVRDKRMKRTIATEIREEFPKKTRLKKKLSHLNKHIDLCMEYEHSVQGLKRFSSIPQYLDYEEEWEE